MGAFIRRNIKYQMHLLWKSAAVTAVLFVFLALYWNMMTADTPDMAGQPFFIVITVLIPFTLSYQYAALYLNIALGTCNTRSSALAGKRCHFHTAWRGRRCAVCLSGGGKSCC